MPAVEVSVRGAGVAGMKFTVVADEETWPCPCTADSPLTVTVHVPGPVAESSVPLLTMRAIRRTGAVEGVVRRSADNVARVREGRAE